MRGWSRREAGQGGPEEGKSENEQGQAGPGHGLAGPGETDSPRPGSTHRPGLFPLPRPELAR